MKKPAAAKKVEKAAAAAAPVDAPSLPVAKPRARATASKARSAVAAAAAVDDADDMAVVVVTPPAAKKTGTCPEKKIELFSINSILQPPPANPPPLLPLVWRCSC